MNTYQIRIDTYQKDLIHAVQNITDVVNALELRFVSL